MALEAKMVKLSILNSLRNLYGIHGSGAYEFSILHVDEKNNTILLHTESSHVISVRSAITFTTSIQGRGCKLDVDNMATSLMGLAII